MVSNVTIGTAIKQQQSTANSSASLADDFSQFLTLLTVQLQNQDPLSPMDTTEFTNQLVAFSGVEQQINSNQKLDSLVSLALASSFTGAQSYVGKNVSYVSSEFSFNGQSPQTITYALEGEAVFSEINIRDATGRAIYTEDAKKSGGPHEFTWNGKLNGGGIAPAGTYSVHIDALDIDDNAVQGTTVVRGLVRGVETQNGQLFVLVGDRAVPVSNILNTTVPKNDLNSNELFTTALSYIGLDVGYNNSEIEFDGSTEAKVDYDVTSNAERGQFLVFNDEGKLVYSEKLETSIIGRKKETVTNDDGTTTQVDGAPIYGVKEGPHTLRWNGKLNDNTIAPKGTYSFAFDLIDFNDDRIAVNSFAESRVTGIETKGGEIFLVTEKGNVALSNITSTSVPKTQAAAAQPPTSAQIVEAVTSQFGQQGNNLTGDLNGDGVVNIADLAIAANS